MDHTLSSVSSPLKLVLTCGAVILGPFLSCGLHKWIRKRSYSSKLLRRLQIQDSDPFSYMVQPHMRLKAWG